MHHMSKPELLSLLRQARSVSRRDHLMILVGFSHGLRATEVVRLTRDNFRDGFLTVQRLKGSKKTSQPLLCNAEPLLDERTAVAEYLATLPGHKLFDISREQFWKIMQKHGEAADIPRHLRHCHVLKHTTGMTAIKGGIENARQYLGHKSIASTGAYLNVDDQAASKAFATAMGD